MKLFSAYKKTKFFLAVNILGLAVGLAAAIMLILFVTYEYGYDRHFANAKRTVQLISASQEGDDMACTPICLRNAYTTLPARVPGIEAATQMFDSGKIEMRHGEGRLPGVRTLLTDPEFFKVFPLTFVEGAAENALVTPKSAVITRPTAEALFKNSAAAMGKTVKVGNGDYIVSAVVEPFPLNTHFSFDALAAIEGSFIADASGLDFHTFYLVESGRDIDTVRAAIEREYTSLLAPWAERLSLKAWGETNLLTDVYLKGKSDWTLGKKGSMSFIWMLSALVVVILLFAITNFINLFTAQGETRMKEIAVRKTHGASVGDLVRQLFAEVGAVVAVAFVLGIVLATQLTPMFASLIRKQIDIAQFWNPVFVGWVVALFVITVVLSASYTSFYLSRQNPLDIFGKRLRFMRNRRLSTAIVCFQSVVTIVLMALIVVIGRQANYLKNIPLGYNPRGVMILSAGTIPEEAVEAVVQELKKLPIVETAAASNHVIGGGYSGQGIGRLDDPDGAYKRVNEYRILPGYGELMGLELIEGEFFTDRAPHKEIVLNQAAVRMLGLEQPVAGQQVNYKGNPVTVTGVVRDFVYANPSGEIQPLVFSWIYSLKSISIRLRDGVDRIQAHATIQSTMRRFDPDYVVSPQWSEDIYESKFADINHQGRMIFVASVVSVILAMMGLLAIHIYSAIRRTREIGIRRIHGASRVTIFALLSLDMLRWIALAGVIAVPFAAWLGIRWSDGFTHHASLHWSVFVVPVVVQMAIALAVTAAVSINVSSRNPVNSLKSE
jgi:putative ABC transport system permease protein